MIPQLGADPGAPFPPPDEALDEPDGLLAWGGDLDPLRLLNAYRAGIFPWYSAGQPILWWCPSTRCVIPPQRLHVSRRLARTLRQGRFRITADRAFPEIIAACARPRPSQPSTWITAEMQQAYTRLHHMGVAHSLEAWLDDQLAGGIYGLALGRMFFGESMYSEARDASKVLLALLCRQLSAWNYALLDCQVSNPHLRQMGARQMRRADFLRVLAANIDAPGVDGPWTGRFDGEAVSA